MKYVKLEKIYLKNFNFFRMQKMDESSSCRISDILRSSRRNTSSPSRRENFSEINESSPFRRNDSSPSRRNALSPSRRNALSPSRRESSSPSRRNTLSSSRRNDSSHSRRESSSPSRRNVLSPSRRNTLSPSRRESSSPFGRNSSRRDIFSPSGRNLSSPTKRDRLLNAINDNDYDEVKYLINSGIEPSKIMLDKAIRNNNYDIAKLLIENGAPIPFVHEYENIDRRIRNLLNSQPSMLVGPDHPIFNSNTSRSRAPSARYDPILPSSIRSPSRAMYSPRNRHGEPDNDIFKPPTW